LAGISIIVGIVGVSVAGTDATVLQGRIQDVSVVKRFVLGGGWFWVWYRLLGIADWENFQYWFLTFEWLCSTLHHHYHQCEKCRLNGPMVGIGRIAF